MKSLLQIPVNKCIPTSKVKNDEPLVCGILFFMSKYAVDYVPQMSNLTFVRLVRQQSHAKGVKRVYGKAVYLCRCGNEVELFTANVYKGRTMSCGCQRGLWTLAQDKILTDFFPDLNKIANATGKTILAVNYRAKKLKQFHAPKVSLWYDKIPIEVRAYLAGHFDGEGCAAFRKRKVMRAPILLVVAAHKSVLDMYYKHFGGAVDNQNTLRRKERCPSHKPLYRWRCVGYESLYNFILSSLPFSMEKREQLICLKDYIEAYLKNGKKASLGKRLVEYSLQLHERCTLLKKST